MTPASSMTFIGPVLATGPDFTTPINSSTRKATVPSAPTVFISSGKVNITPPTTNTDGTPVAAGEITSYNVGVRSTTVVGSVPGTYPFTNSINASASPLTISLTTLGLTKQDTYAAAAEAVYTGGITVWGPEFIFVGVPSVPNPPAVFVA